MKKLLSATLALTIGAGMVFGLAACGKKSNKDKEIAQKAITNLKDLYETDTPKEEPRDYKVVGVTPVSGVFYDVDWSVSDNVSAYATISEIDEEDNMVTISVSRQTVDIEYTLTASVTVGKETASYGFKKILPAKQTASDRQTTQKSISFKNADARTQQTTEIQVWEQNGIKITNQKANSSSNVADYTNPARFYVGSTVKIECAGMISLTVDSNKKYDNNDYPSNLKNSLEASGIPATITIDGTNVTIVLEMAVDYFEFAITTQVQIYAIDIDAVVGGVTDADKVDAAKAMTKLDKTIYTEKDTYNLPDTAFGADLVWKVKGTSNLVSVSNNKLTVNNLPETSTDVTLTATVTAGNETDTLEVVITIMPLGKFTAITTPVAGTYKYGMDVKGIYYYMNGEMDSRFFATTTDVSKAADVVLEADGEGWLLKVNGKFIEMITTSDGGKGVAFNDAQTNGGHWLWNDTYKIFTWDLAQPAGTYFLGTYSSFTTMSSSAISYLSGSSASSQYPARLGTFGAN